MAHCKMDQFSEDDNRSAPQPRKFPHFAFDSITFFAKDGKQKAAVWI